MLSFLLHTLLAGWLAGGGGGEEMLDNNKNIIIRHIHMRLENFFLPGTRGGVVSERDLFTLPMSTMRPRNLYKVVIGAVVVVVTVL